MLEETRDEIAGRVIGGSPELRAIRALDRKKRRVVPDPIATYEQINPDTPLKVRIVSLGTRKKLQDASGQPLDDETIEQLRQAPHQFLVFEGRVYTQDDPLPSRFQRLEQIEKGRGRNAWNQAFDEAVEILDEQIERNQKNTPFENCRQKDQLVSQLHNLITQAQERGEQLTEREVRLRSLRYLSDCRAKLRAADGIEVQVEVGVRHKDTRERWVDNDVWYVAAEKEETDLGFKYGKGGRQFPVSTIITVDSWQLAEEVGAEADEGKPTGRFWFRLTPERAIPSNFDEEMGMWGITKATGRERYNPPSMPANEFVVQETIKALDSALSTPPEAKG